MQRKAGKSTALAALIIILGFGSGSRIGEPASIQAQATPVPVPGDGTRTFPETGKTVNGLFLDYWNNNGGLPQQGYPISDEMQETSDLNGKTYTVQYFERAVFEYHPENRAPYNVLLTQLGTLLFKAKYPDGEPGGASLTLPASAAQTPCTATTDDPPGPYEPNPPIKNSVGKGHIVRGFVLSTDGCLPIAGAKVEMWPEIAGIGHDPNDRAAVLTDATGAYRFESRPPEHIHMHISAPGYKTIYSNAYHPAPGQAEGTFNIVLVPDPNCLVFQESGQAVCGAFLDYWKRHGGLAQQGYPISREFAEKSDLDGKTYTVQYFERAVFEKHPENQPPYDVLLSQLGTFRYKAKYEAGQLPANLNLNDFYEQVFRNLLLRDPETFTGVGLPDSYAPDFHNDKLTNVHDAYLQQTYALAKQYLQQLKTYDPKLQTPQQLVSTAIMEWHLDDVLHGQEFMYDDYIVNPVTGVQNNLEDLMVNLQPLDNKQDAQDYVARLGEYGTKFDGVMEQLRLREQKGIVPPQWMVQSTLNQMRFFVNQDPTQNELYTYFKTRLDEINNLSAADRQSLLASAEKAVRETVYPAYQLVIDYLTDLLPKGRITDGVWDLPNGDAYYQYAIHHYTTTDMTPEEIYNLGLSEVARVRGEMQTILDGLGYKGLGFADAMNKVAEDSGSYQTRTQAQKEQVLDAFQALIIDANNRIASQFDIKPTIGVEVRAVPTEKEAGSPGGYYFAPALDGSRPGIFYVNLGRPTFPKYQMPTLAYHEAIPGHHFQLGIQTELTNVPTFQRSGIFPTSTGYTEGWGLYAEQLAYEAGFYKDDPYGNLGRLQAELFRSARLVVDTGIHWKRWTRAQANKYMEDTLGTPPGSYASEVDRYIAWPGQALGYKIGELKIVELREKAKKALGSKFDIKEFHDVVLQNGTVPLEVLETLVDNYIASKK